MVFTIIGWLVVTGLLLWFTIGYIGLHFMAVAFAGWRSLKDGGIWSLVWLAGIVLGWWAWWHYVAQALDISISIN